MDEIESIRFISKEDGYKMIPRSKVSKIAGVL